LRRFSEKAAGVYGAHGLESPPENVARKFNEGPDDNQEAFLTDLGRHAAKRNFNGLYCGDPSFLERLHGMYAVRDATDFKLRRIRLF